MLCTFILTNFKNFKGVFHPDNAPFLNQNDAIICNISEMDEAGTHFVLLFRKRKKTLYYFDPLKLRRIPDDIQKYLSQYNNIVNVENISEYFQGAFSKFCNDYCVLVFLSVNIGINFWLKKVRVSFCNDYSDNDDLHEIINDILPKSLSRNKKRNF